MIMNRLLSIERNNMKWCFEYNVWTWMKWMFIDCTILLNLKSIFCLRKYWLNNSIYLTGSGRPLRGLPSCYIAYLLVHIFLNGMLTKNKLVFYKPFILFTLFTIFKFYNQNNFIVLLNFDNVLFILIMFTHSHYYIHNEQSLMYTRARFTQELWWRNVSVSGWISE